MLTHFSYVLDFEASLTVKQRAALPACQQRGDFLPTTLLGYSPFGSDATELLSSSSYSYCDCPSCAAAPVSTTTTQLQHDTFSLEEDF